MFSLTAQNAGRVPSDIFEEIAGRGLIIETTPAGAKVFIDGVERGETPVTLEDMLTGEYQIRLTRDGYHERIFYITLFSTSRLAVTINMEEELGMVYINVHKAPGSPGAIPFHPQIFSNTLDNTLASEGLVPQPLSSDNKALLYIPTGYRTIRARAFGWEETSATVLVSAATAASVDLSMKPAQFKIGNAFQSRKRFNPLNPSNLGVTDFRFDVSAPGTGTLSVLNADEEVIFKKELESFNSWHQNTTWNGRDSSGNLVPEGLYTMLIEAVPLYTGLNHDTAQNFSLKLETEINYSIHIFPMSLESGISGLTFTPMPHVLPKGSYQIMAGIQFGSFRLPVTSGECALRLPFEINMRFSPVDRLELTAAFNINAHIENQMQTGAAGWGITGSTKFNIIDKNLLVFSTGISYAWASETGELPLSPGRGIGLHSPISLEVADFSIIICPSLFWQRANLTGNRTPDTEEFAPEILISAGILHRGTWMNSGVSARGEFSFKEISARPRLLTGTEFHFFPSNLIISLLVGVSMDFGQENHVGGYGGIKIGIIN